jgi:hypothetical protein
MPKVKMQNTEGKVLGMEKSDAIILETYCYHRDAYFNLVGTKVTHNVVDKEYHLHLMMEHLRLLLRWEMITNTTDLHTTWIQTK